MKADPPEQSTASQHLSQESVARGCALQAAILSPLYKVRDFEVKDFSPFGISISWLGFGGDAPLDGSSENTEAENGEKKARGRGDPGKTVTGKHAYLTSLAKKGGCSVFLLEMMI